MASCKMRFDAEGIIENDTYTNLYKLTNLEINLEMKQLENR